MDIDFWNDSIEKALKNQKDTKVYEHDDKGGIYGIDEKEDAHYSNNDWNNNNDHDEEKFGYDNSNEIKKNIVSWNGFHFVVQENAETGCYYLLEEYIYHLIPRNVEEQCEKKINAFGKGWYENDNEYKYYYKNDQTKNLKIVRFVDDKTNNEITEKVVYIRSQEYHIYIHI